MCVRQLPALNSDFAKKMGKETMEEYRAFVKQQLFDGRHGGALNHAKDMILGQLADAAEGEIPSILVENAYQQQMQVIQQQLQMQRLSLDRYLSQIHQTRESFTAAVRTAAEKNTRARIALLIEGHVQYAFMTIEQIERFYARFYPRWNRDAYYGLMEMLKVAPRQRISRMSCGQRSQVALGLLFAQDPELLILDDFSMGLDPGYRRLFVEYLREYASAENKTVFLTSHIIQDMEKLVDDCILSLIHI